MAKKKIENATKIEREYVIPLREKCRPVPRYKKTNKAIKTIKEYLVRHMKIYDKDLKKVKIDKYLNEIIWKRGIKNPPHKIKVKVVKEGENVIVTAVEFPKDIKFKKLRHEKREKAAEEVKAKKKSLMQKAKETTAKPKESDEAKTEEKPEEKKIEKEKAAAVKEVAAKEAKAKAKEMKHSTKTNVKQSKRPIRKTMDRA